VLRGLSPTADPLARREAFRGCETRTLRSRKWFKEDRANSPGDRLRWCNKGERTLHRRGRVGAWLNGGIHSAARGAAITLLDQLAVGSQNMQGFRVGRRWDWLYQQPLPCQLLLATHPADANSESVPRRKSSARLPPGSDSQLHFQASARSSLLTSAYSTYTTKTRLALFAACLLVPEVISCTRCHIAPFRSRVAPKRTTSGLRTPHLGCTKFGGCSTTAPKLPNTETQVFHAQPPSMTSVRSRGTVTNNTFPQFAQNT
jgi:hypothetical protein